VHGLVGCNGDAGFCYWRRTLIAMMADTLEGRAAAGARRRWVVASVICTTSDNLCDVPCRTSCSSSSSASLIGGALLLPAVVVTSRPSHDDL